MTEIRQCWAFHKDGTRCTHPAGHNGDHVVERTWSDSECAMPVQATTVRENAPLPIPLPEPLVHEPLKCVGCGHQHKNGPCKCGCYEFIG